MIHPHRVGRILQRRSLRALPVLCRLVPVSVDKIHLSGLPFPGERALPFILYVDALILLLDPREVIRVLHPGLFCPRRYYLRLKRQGPLGLQGDRFEDAVGDHSQTAVFLRTIVLPPLLQP